MIVAIGNLLVFAFFVTKLSHPDLYLQNLLVKLTYSLFIFPIPNLSIIVEYLLGKEGWKSTIYALSTPRGKLLITFLAL